MGGFLFKNKFYGGNYMGCDIHLSVEKKVNDEWKLVKAVDQLNLDFFVNVLTDLNKNGENSQYSYMSKLYVQEQIKKIKSKKTKDWLYNGRNYDLFSILADVRNGFGFAGAMTGEGFKSICYPKGVPSDASEEYKAEVEDWGDDAHSHSYHTLKQLTDYDWGQITIHHGCVPLDEYKACKENNRSPERWCTSVGGGSVQVISSESADALLAGEWIAEEDKTYYVKTKWSTLYKDTSEFYEKCIPLLEELSEDGTGEDVRIVFFFDN